MFDVYIYTGDLESNFQIFSVREEVVSLGEKLEAKMVEVQASKNTVSYNQIYPNFFLQIKASKHILSSNQYFPILFTNKGEQKYSFFKSKCKEWRAKILFLPIKQH